MINEVREHIVQSYEAGQTISDIMRSTGYAYTVVWKALHKGGAHMRTSAQSVRAKHTIDYATLYNMPVRLREMSDK